MRLKNVQRAEASMLWKAGTPGERCIVCGQSRCYGACKCEEKFEDVITEVRELTHEAQRLKKAWIGFCFEDWLYLRLIANDLENQLISQDEAKSEGKRYINAIYEDAMGKLRELKRNPQDDGSPNVTTKAIGQEFMDEILS